MNEWELSISRAREDFIEGIVRSGFLLDDDGKTIKGLLELPEEAGEGSQPLIIQLPDEFPFKAPKVRPNDGCMRTSWHCEPDGWLCLYSESDTLDLPWSNPSAFLRRVVEWFVKDNQGWADDAPDLDLDRYFHRAGLPLIYENLDNLIGKPIRAKLNKEGDILEFDHIWPAKVQGKRKKNEFFGWVADLGELDQPVHDWKEIAASLGDRAGHIQAEIQGGRCQFLLLRYIRHGLAAAIVLFVSGTSPIKLEAGYALDKSQDILRLRAGADATALESCSVAIIGTGAIGSFLADLFARAGIGRLTLQDGQILKPGNCVRHLAGLYMVGRDKASAVRLRLCMNGYIGLEQVHVKAHSLGDPAEAYELLMQNDLVIDATGSDPVLALLRFLAESSGQRLVSAYTQRDGAVVRCDRWPLAEGEEHAPTVPPAQAPLPVLRESGCGDPISPTPPFAVLAAASLAFRMAVDLLTNCGLFGPSVIEVLQAQDDEPYNQLGIML